MLLVSCSIVQVSAQLYNITDFGAKADGKTVNTTYIQKAVDECAAKGGGTVLVPPGTFITAMILLKSSVHLQLSAGAVLEALADGAKYASLLYINNVQDVAVTGEGTLFGNGKKFKLEENAPGRPFIIFVKNSRNVRVENVRLLHSASWAFRLQGSEHVVIRGVSIYSHANYNNDGIDIDSKDVVISDCIIDSGDDAICLKSDDPAKLCENIVVTNCILASNCNLIKMGTSSFGGFKNIAISNCVLRKASESPLHHWNEPASHRITDSISGISGIALEMVDGGSMDQVTISNISMTGVQTPLFIRLGSRKNATGILKNILISHITASSCSNICSSITAVPGYYIENVVLRDLLFNSKGGGTASEAAATVPEKGKAYPENRMFGWSLPAYGLYIRHAKNIRMDNVRFTLQQPDARPAIWLEDAHDISADVPGTGESLIRQVKTTKVILRN